ncbi:MAG TPA: copper resistance protein CopC [Pseudonocardia sp.]|jgi:copper transport protein|nr:copper resistance protein CopC [Pseudonocardia sp.]
MDTARASGRPRHWWRRVAVGLLLTAAGLLAGAGTASAHAVLLSTDPARDTVLPARPAQVRLTFGESVQLPPNALRVFDPDGVEVDDGHPEHPGVGDSTVGIGLRPGTAQGSYTVAWRVISADTHPVSGAFTFSVGHPSATNAATEAPAGGSATVGVLYAIVRALAYGSFAALFGTVAFLLWCWPAGAAATLAPRIAATGWATLLLSSIATLLLQGPYGDGTGLADIVEPGAVATTLSLPLGGALIARLLLLTATAVYLGQLRHRLPSAGAAARRWLRIVGGTLALGTASTWSISGHAAVGLQPGIAFPADLAHLLAMATWLGGLGVLAAALRRTPTGATEHRELAAAVTRFSPIALGCVGVLVATGTYQSWRQVGSWTALAGTDYGRILLLKIVAVAAVLAVALVSRRAVHRMRARDVPGPDPRLRRTVLAEAAIATVVIALTAILVNAEPGRTAQAAAEAAAQGPVQATLAYDTGGPGGQGTLDIRIDPARTGPNSIEVTVRGATGPARDVAELGVELSLPQRHLGPLALPVTHQGTGSYQAAGQIPFPGQWDLALTVRTSNIDETTVRVPLTVH